MKYNVFMEQVAERLAQMTEKQKSKWIRHVARKTTEDERKDFLNSLTAAEVPIDYPSLSMIKEIEAWCEKIESQDIYLECSSYEEYGASCWDQD